MTVFRQRLTWVGLSLAASVSSMLAPAVAQAADVETIVMVRHGEKPAAGLGQLDCQGLNRALALPRVLNAKYGPPGTIFAPNPSKQKNDRGALYDYVRPLATIEPTAIAAGLPVDTSIGFADLDALHTALLAPRLATSTVYVAWEHAVIEQFARRVVKETGGHGKSVPRWESPDYDSIYVLRITRDGDKLSAAFSIDHEGLDGRAAACP